MARVVVIGAARRRQGTGPFVARAFHEAGAEVAGVVGTSLESARAASTALKEEYGIRAAAYTDIERALASERPDILAISSPHETHRSLLHLAAEAGVDCLCEKPLWWEPGLDFEEETARIADAFLARDRHLGILTQWPETLPGFFMLWPEARDTPVETFEMELCPMFPGIRMIPDALPHPLSLLFALAGTGRVTEPRAEFAGPDRHRLSLSFRFEHEKGNVVANCRFSVMERGPRPAAYAINGQRADREIEPSTYRMSLEAEGRRVPIDDPLDLRVRRFLTEAGYPDPGGPRTGPATQTDREMLIGGMVALDLLTKAADK